MPFKALAAKAIAKIAPKVLPTVAKVIPKVLPQVRTIAGVVGKVAGITGALPGGASLPQVMAAAPIQIPQVIPGMGGLPGTVRQIPRMGARGGREPNYTKTPFPAPVPGRPIPIPQEADMGPLLRGAGAVAGALTAAQMAKKMATGLFDSAGRWFSDRRVAALARRVGLELAAAGLGVAVALVATSVARDSTRAVRRRRRGISWGQLNTTRRTLRKFESMNRYLCRPSAPKRRAACR